jgi:hypothetical protein
MQRNLEQEFIEKIRNRFVKITFSQKQPVQSFEQVFCGNLNYLLLFEKIKLFFINIRLPILLTVNQQ